MTVKIDEVPLATKISDSERRIADLIKQTNEIPSLLHIIAKNGRSEPNIVNFELEGGKTVKARALLGDEHSGIIVISLDPGDSFPLHTHTQWEMVLVLSGEFIITSNGEDKLYKPRDYIILESNVPHSIRTDKGGVAVGITIPRAEGFPKVLLDV